MRFFDQELLKNKKNKKTCLHLRDTHTERERVRAGAALLVRLVRPWPDHFFSIMGVAVN